MRMLLLSLVLLAFPAWAQEANTSAADQAAIASVIQAQIEAFRHDDAPGAFAYAAPSIQAMFENPDRFMAMVRAGYPPVYRPRSVDMAGLEQIDGQLTQKVELTGPDGQPALALYTMQRQADGNWKITGCALTTSKRVGA